MKLYFIILFVLIFGSLAKADDIISDASISSSSISLGDEISIQFDINELSDCDSYSIDYEIDYLWKEIIITIDYDYDSSCDASTDYNTEEIEIIPLLEGTYEVTIDCNVSFYSELDEEVDLDDLFVDKPYDDCDASYVPIILESCPIFGEEVCACNGINYDNECEAYFEEEQGIYYNFTCGDYIASNSLEFECGEFKVDLENTFIEYGCSSDDFDGDELYLEYEHKNDGDSLNIYFNSYGSDLTVFLVSLDYGDIECIAVSDGSKLEVADLNSGTYYVIVDSGNEFNKFVTICDINSIGDVLEDSEISITPNPNKSYFLINSIYKIKEVTIINNLGIEEFNKSYDNREIRVDHNLKSGIYFAIINTDNKMKISKIIVE